MTEVAPSASSGFTPHLFLGSLLPVAGGILLVLLLTYLVSLAAHKHSVIDTAWGLLYCAAALVSFTLSAGHGNNLRRFLLLAMTLLWGLRLAVHIGRRSIGKGEDPRYEELLKDRGALQTVLLVYGLQGLLAYLVSMPIVVGSFESRGLTPLAWFGVALWIVGVLFEGVGDWQMERYKAAKAAGEPVGSVMDTGLWRYTRHPNYFGDACVWVGIFCVCAERWPGVLTLFSPAIMVYLLAFGSGKRVLERSMAKRAGYREYMRRTSGFIPLPPKRATEGS
jgi:steroid 5-alpha reductase family enzyme